MDWEKVYRELSKRNWIILLVLSAISTLFMSYSLTLGIILGGFVVILNFDVLQRTIRRAFPANGTAGAKPLLVVKTYFRLLALGVVIYLLIRSGSVDPIGLAIGLSTVVFSIVSFGISCARRPTGEAT